MARTLIKELKDTRKNYLINGEMRVAQRGTSFVSPASSTFILDRYQYFNNSTATHTVTRDTDVPTLAQAGYLFQNSLRLNLTAADTSIAAGDFMIIQQKMEGYVFQSLAQKPMNISFWVKATLPGTYCVALRNSGTDRSFVAEYVVNASNTWEYKTIAVPASPSAGTWNYAAGVGLHVSWAVATGSTFHTTPGAWQTGSFFATANQVNGINTGATDFKITGLMINEGSTAAPFRLFADDFENELEECQRYYEPDVSVLWTGQTTSGNAYAITGYYAVTKRAIPSASLTSVNTSNFDGGTITAPNIRADNIEIQLTANATGGAGLFRARATLTAEL
jgi:hypothetical protein